MLKTNKMSSGDVNGAERVAVSTSLAPVEPHRLRSPSERNGSRYRGLVRRELPLFSCEPGVNGTPHAVIRLAISWCFPGPQRANY